MSVEKVSGGCSTRLADHMAWPAGQHLAPNHPLQVSGGPIHSYKYPLTVKVDTHTHHILDIPLAKLSFLV
jgi:hypothetical protein